MNGYRMGCVAVTTGDSVLDEVLGGGLPEGKTTLLAGGPGTGKSTLAMQFLQAALDRGERCLYLSTEQSPSDLRAAFSSFDFALDHDELDLASIHARPGDTVEGDETLVLDTFDDDEPFGGFDAPFASEYIERYLDRFENCDYVVFDSMSGQASLADGDRDYRQVALDLAYTLQEEVGATSLLTAERPESRAASELEYAAHAVIRLDTVTRNGESVRRLRVPKVRGADHDRRTFVVQVTESGVQVAPESRTPTAPLVDEDRFPTGVPGMAEVTGGGVVRGSLSLLEYDGAANVMEIAASAVGETLQNGRRVVLVPPPHLSPAVLERALPADVASVENLLASQELVVLDLFGEWPTDAAGVHSYSISGTFRGWLSDNAPLYPVWRLLRQISAADRSREGQPTLAVIFLEGFFERLGAGTVRRAAWWAMSRALHDDDAWFCVLNPDITDDETVEYFRHTARRCSRRGRARTASSASSSTRVKRDS